MIASKAFARFAGVAAGLVFALGIVAGTGCDLEIGDLNNPGLDELQETPTRVSVAAAATGLLIGNRSNYAAANGYVSQLGILGRESYNFDVADPRYIDELLKGKLSKGSPFGGNFWGFPYANIRLANIVQTAVEKVDFSGEEKSATVGFSKTIAALDLLTVIVTHDTNGAVIDTTQPLDGDLAPIVDKDETYAEIARLLDEGAAELAGGGAEFPFPLSDGYAGFDTPATFLKFNKAIRARVAVYMAKYDEALSALAGSFLDEMAMTVAGMEVGVYHSYSTSPGDAVNGLINPNIYAHPSVMTDAEAGDARYARKIATVPKGGGVPGLSSNLVFTAYDGPAAPVPIIRNEELILLKAEALFNSGMVAQAVDELNIVRTVSGGLTAIGGNPTAMEFVDALLYERRYSLLFEGGHRWIDTRRLGRTADLPLDDPAHILNIRYPIPQAECNARPGEPACTLGST